VAAGTVHDSVTKIDFAAWCLDTAGNLIWHRQWDGGFGGFEQFGDLVVDATGAVWVCGASPESTASYPYDLTIASWDSTGAFRWSWRYRGAGPGFSQYATVAAVTG